MSQIKVQPIVLSFLMLAFLAVSPDAAAACAANLSASLSGTDLIVTASASGGQCNGAMIHVTMSNGETAAKQCSDAPSCQATFTFSVACYRTGSHTVMATAHCNLSGTCHLPGESSSPVTAAFTVNTTPTVSISAEPLNEQGLVRFSMPYNFPNTAHAGQRHLELFIDGVAVRSTGGLSHINLDTASGTWQVDYDMSCRSTGAHEAKVVATACGYTDPEHRVEAQTTVAINSKPEVSVSYVEPPGQLAISYYFPNTGSWGARAIDLYVNGQRRTSTVDARSSPHPLEQQRGVWNVAYDTACGEPRTDEILVVARACGKPDDEANEGYIARARTNVSVNPRPDVSLSATEDAAGNDLLDIAYSFPHTTSSGQRSIALFIDGVLHSTHQPEQISGSLPPVSLGATCWETAKAVATACNRTGDERFRDEQEIESNHNDPIVSLILRKSTDPSRGRFEARVTYNLRENVANRFVRVERLSWIDANGREHLDREVIGERDASAPLSDTDWTVWFNPPSRARQVRIRATAQACGRETANASIDCGCDGTADPVYFADGNMRLTDTDPLPVIAGHSLTRTYNSDDQVAGLFGRGFSTRFEQRLMRDVIDGDEVVSIVTPAGDIVTFDGRNGVFRMTWPPSASSTAALSHNAAAGTYLYRAADSTEVAEFRASDGKLLVLHELGTGREARIAYQAGVPAAITDSWTGVTWTLTTEDRRVSSIAVNDQSDLTWSYQYDANGNLTRVTAPGGSTWRTYEYVQDRMTASRDALGNLIESHTFDEKGYAIDSTGPGDEIESIQYDLPGSTPQETITRVTAKTGAVTDYVLRPSGGGPRVVQILGACASCGGGRGDRTLVRDERGRVIREQRPDGYITVSEFDGNHLVAEEQHLKPVGCDPQVHDHQCRMTTDQLADVGLVPTSATIRTVYRYDEPAWPERVTSVITPSIMVLGGVRREDISYHSASGAVVARTITGHPGGREQQPTSRGTITTLYGARAGGEDDDTDPLAPAFDPGGAFQSAWLSLPQPAFLPKTTDGPRNDADDVTAFVYYPIDPSVPPLLRGRLAASRNAVGHITRFESYDVFGNITRVVDPNGVVTETTYDTLGRLKTSTLKGMPGACEPWKDALCTVDLTSTRTYSPAAGPLLSEQAPGGSITVYAYDDRRRVKTISRGPSAADLRERIEYSYDPLTGNESSERRLAFEGGAWIEKSRESYAYNAHAELVTITHADGTSVTHTYDAAGRLASLQDETHTFANTTYAYDAAGRTTIAKQRLEGAAGGWISTLYSYDLHGNLTALTDPNGNVTRYTYDDFGALLAQHSPVTGTTMYRFDDANNLTATTDANLMTTTRAYDALNRPVSATSSVAPPSNEEPPDEDDGRPDDGPPLAPPAPATRTEVITWAYDDPTPGRYAIGRLSMMTDPAGTTVYDYERRGLLTEEVRTFSGCFVTRESGTDCAEFFASRTYTTAYGYDRDGNRTSIAYPSNKVTVNYTFDYAGRPLSASGAVTSATYLPFGPLTQLVFDNGMTQTLSYDARYQITSNTLTGTNATLASYGYRHDAAGNITAIDDQTDAAYSRTFAYDDLHRLITANTGSALWRTGSYAWDAMGNILSAKLGEVAPGGDDGLLRTRPRVSADAERLPLGRSQEFTYDGTTARLATVTTNELQRVAVAHDAAGNERSYIIERGYSARNLLSEVATIPEEPGETFRQRLLYAYDGRGIRVVRGESPGPSGEPLARRYYFYTPDLKHLGVTHIDTNTTDPNHKDLQYAVIWFGDRPVAQVPLTGSRRFTFADHLGTPLLQTDSNGTVIWRAEYEPFGNIAAMREGERADQPLRFPGQQFAMSWEGQEENYNVFRSYRSGWGRYTSADPLVKSDTPYSYANGNPVRNIDPLGLFTIDDTIRNNPIYTAAIDQVCRGSGGRVTGGACTINLFAYITCDCRCAGTRFTAAVTLHLRGRMYVYSGPFQQLRRTRNVHASVTDAASAIRHEYDYHLTLAINAVTPIITSLESRTWPTVENCESDCMVTNEEVRSRFGYVRHESQRIEERGGDPRNVRY